MLLVALIATGDIQEFCECLRDAVELPLVMESVAALHIVTQVYVWMGLKLAEFLKMGMQLQQLEELRGLGIKYLESHELFDEEQR